MANKINRGPSMSNVELLAFCSAVERRHEILFNTQSGPNFKKKIEEAWMDLGRELEGMGYPRFKDKSVKQLRGDIWSKKKEAALKKYDESQRTGKGQTNFEEWENIVIRLSKGTKQADGLSIADSGESMPTEQQEALGQGQAVQDEEELVILGESEEKRKEDGKRGNAQRPSSASRPNTPYSVRSACSNTSFKRKFSDDVATDKNILQVEILRQDLEYKKLLVYEKKTQLGIPATIETDDAGIIPNEPMQRREHMRAILYREEKGQEHAGYSGGTGGMVQGELGFDADGYNPQGE